MDLFLSRHLVAMSRSQIQKAITEGHILVNGHSTKTGHRLRRGDEIDIRLPAPQPSPLQPEEMALDILYEDAFLLVLNKPAGLVVHPAAGHHGGTLVNGLLDHCRDLSGVGGVLRPGIVHRLDKDTSGLMVVAKTDLVHRALSDQFRERRVCKVYHTLVYGDMAAEMGRIDLPIGRHPVERKMMSTKSRRGKEAITRWSVGERFGVATLLDVFIETGRTHQIRVHLHAAGHPVVGDAVYGRAGRFRDMASPQLQVRLKQMNRQALHAGRIRFFHPERKEEMVFSAPMPADMADLCQFLRDGGGR